MKADNAKIAKNTIMLYIRMFVNMAISVYTSRVVLATLGVDDYGIYNVVGGVVIMFSFFQNALSTATQRFLNFELGRKEGGNVNHVFCVSLIAHIILALFIAILLEAVGLWFLSEKLNVPDNRLSAAQIVFHLSVLSCCLGIIRMPYNAAIIAYEKMSFFAYISIAETLLRLLIVYVLVIWNVDKLILYANLLLIVSIVILLANIVYCLKKFGQSCMFHFVIDKGLSKNLIGFTGWSLFVGVANVGCTQGTNMILNVYKGVAVNASMGIANQVSNAIYSFISNFQLAYSPQIMKLYAAEAFDELHKLVCRTSKYSFLLMLLISLPFIVCCQDLIDLWLVETPEYAISFTQIIIVIHLLDALSAPLWLSIQATGNIRFYQIVCGTLLLLNIPLSIIALKVGLSPNSVLWIRLGLSLVVCIFRVPYVCKRIRLSISMYSNTVLLRCLIVLVMAGTVSFLFHELFFNCLLGTLFSLLISILSVTAFSYIIGFTKDERVLFNKKINNYKIRILNEKIF